MRRMTPIASILAGAVAGALGSIAQDLFFAATAKVAPEEPKGAFNPPEPEQRDETPTQTVARRTEEMFGRGPIQRKERAGKIVHYAYGTGWGAIYGLIAGSLPAARTWLGGLAFGTGVWMASENLILPLFQLRAWPHRYPMKIHAYDLAAHIVFGAAVWGAFEVASRRPWVNLLALAGAAWSTRRVPRFVRAPVRKALTAVREAEAVVQAAAP